mmetsp:Transcript_72326/g.205335  ORF Transcript_72326/g.205335 Transcript_72326/m.205335 type:complete len:229 (+) Transcript_72326:1315-2001(+)
MLGGARLGREHLLLVLGCLLYAALLVDPWHVLLALLSYLVAGDHAFDVGLVLDVGLQQHLRDAVSGEKASVARDKQRALSARCRGSLEPLEGESEVRGWRPSTPNLRVQDGGTTTALLATHDAREVEGFLEAKLCARVLAGGVAVAVERQAKAAGVQARLYALSREERSAAAGRSVVSARDGEATYVVELLIHNVHRKGVRRRRLAHVHGLVSADLKLAAAVLDRAGS